MRSLALFRTAGLMRKLEHNEQRHINLETSFTKVAKQYRVHRRILGVTMKLTSFLTTAYLFVAWAAASEDATSEDLFKLRNKKSGQGTKGSRRSGSADGEVRLFPHT